MKDKFQCLSCIFSQTLDFVRSSAEDEMDAEAAVRAIFRTMGETDFDREAIAIKRDIGRLARFLCSNGDSFDHFKSRLNRYALEAFPKLVTHVEMAENPLLAALKVSAAVDIFEINTNNHCDLALLKAKLAEVDRQPQRNVERSPGRPAEKERAEAVGEQGGAGIVAATRECSGDRHGTGSWHIRRHKDLTCVRFDRVRRSKKRPPQAPPRRQPVKPPILASA